ncbi:phage tail protein [Pectobacterium brasiliense]|uniref:phage tail protein n=1 Tax=Pectobacterium brasiliense TaxID=180957 RepID=UPI002A80FADE|nr:phage tail protein [Pectobacterium brasiliense]MDY4370063.1 phage tail protein [Pectobacterium brasiliense]MDY7059595.1 phage tail protein [Pectobacterium brasiliense]
MYLYLEALANLGLTETVNLAAGALEKAKNGADIPDRELFNRNMGSGRAYSAAIDIGGVEGEWTTANFIDWLRERGAFSHPYWVCRGSWTYARNRTITDTECGHINLTGAVVEVFGNDGNHTLRVTTPSTAPRPDHYENSQFTYVFNGTDYFPGWRRDYNTRHRPTAADIGALTKKDADSHYVRQGSSGVVYKNDDLAWNSPTGAYLKDNGPHSSLIWHMGLNSGSASAAQFYFDFANGGIKYRSSRDNSGFEKPWARIYTDQDKPTAAEIGALPAAGTAVAATKLVTPRKINGVDFDGSKDITLTANILGSYTKTEADSRYVQSVQRGAAVNPPRTTEYGPDEAPAGCVVTRVLHHPGTAYGVEFTYRPLQIYINGTWRTITG